jgi:predicted O-methyltransferase YrrM
LKEPKYYRIFDYDKELLPNKHLASLEIDVQTIDEARRMTGATIGYPGWNLIYYILLSHLDNNHEEIIIETGTNFGCTTIILAQALIDAKCNGKVVTIEIDKNNVHQARENLRLSRVQHMVEVLHGASNKILPKVVNKYKNIRFAFLDASHLYDDVLFEFETILPSLADDALVLFDNTYQIADKGEDQRVYGALREIERKYGGNFTSLEFVSWYTPGVVIWSKNK